MSQVNSTEAGNKQPLADGHWEHLLSELGPEGLKIAINLGARSIKADEAHAIGFRFKGWSGGGLMLPFAGTFTQLRCDDPPQDSKGDPVKYLSPVGIPQAPVIVGTGPATLATEGFKDSVALHLLTGQAVAGIAGVSAWKQLPDSVDLVIYDADAQHNPGVWGALITAGLERPRLRLAFFPADVAGPKGGACEFRNAGGDFTAIKRWKPRELLRELPRLLPRDLRVDWHGRTLKTMARLATAAGMDPEATDALMTQVAKAIGQSVAAARKALKRSSAASSQCPEDPNKAQLQAFIRSTYSVRFNELSGAVELDGKPMGHIELADSFLAHLHGIETSKQAAQDSFTYVAMANAYNPVAEYLKGLEQRNDLKLLSLEEIAAAFGVTPGDTLSQELLARHLAGAYKRGICPGEKHDQMLIMLGDQGQGKQKAIRALAPEGWYDSATKVAKGLEDREFLGKLNSAWLFEFDECEKALLGRDSSEFKGFTSRFIDKYVQKWETQCRDHPRRCVLFGTSNEREVLNDPTGARRYWMIDVRGGTIRPKWIRQHRDSIWATVATWVAWGLESWIPEGHPTALAAAGRAADARISDVWEGCVREVLEQQLATGMGIGQDDLILRALQTEIKQIDRSVQMKVTRIVAGSDFTTHGGTIRWIQAKRRYGGGQPRSGYVPTCVPDVPTCSDQSWGDWNGATPWSNRDLSTLFQPFQPFRECCVEKKGPAGKGGTGDAISRREIAQNGRNGRNEAAIPSGASDLPFLRDQNRSARNGTADGTTEQGAKPNHRDRVLAIPQGAPVEVREPGKPTINGHRMLNPLGKSEHCQLTGPDGGTVQRPKAWVWPCDPSA
ncbi:virulence-associated E family protein [Synechococcus sp. CS-205]|uniref:virulence-associated E family protein n=1 Tax=Synechococcus sp. CS-205 TaxID=2847984 RepID=UPI00223C4F07|nr:virulence-associated E family protein [Synechococcus sp. CS-205]MCT0247672.1 virulence-associated E family protein [Synechococcus sp. CS-205]